jgi:hypothetical protein
VLDRASFLCASTVRRKSPCIAFGAADSDLIWLIARVDLVSGHQVKWKGWNPCGLAAILRRPGRFATSSSCARF